MFHTKWHSGQYSKALCSAFHFSTFLHYSVELYTAAPAHCMIVLYSSNEYSTYFSHNITPLCQYSGSKISQPNCTYTLCMHVLLTLFNAHTTLCIIILRNITRLTSCNVQAVAFQLTRPFPLQSVAWSVWLFGAGTNYANLLFSFSVLVDARTNHANLLFSVSVLATLRTADFEDRRLEDRRLWGQTLIMTHQCM